jgi:large subunit ribosomal protein L6
MSRIGKQPVSIPAGVTVAVESNKVNVSGPKGNLSLNIPQKIKVEVQDNQVLITRFSEEKKTKANHGTTRALINNMIQGVVTPWKRDLEIKGTGYKASVSGNKLTINAGYINPVVITASEGIQFQVTEDTKISVTGCDKTVVGQFASNIRKIRKPEPYKGKGIRFAGEVIKLKAGKKAKA